MQGQQEMSEAIMDMMAEYAKEPSIPEQKLRVKAKLKQQMDEGKRLLMVSSDVYTALPTGVVTLVKLYDNFAQGYVLNKRTGVKIPYDINYYSLIANRNGLKMYRTYQDIIYEEQHKLDSIPRIWYTVFSRKGIFSIKNHNTRNSNTFNSVGGYYNPSGTSNIKFVRDPEKLLAQYSNLIKYTAKKYNKYWATKADKDELYSYIVDTFISLVYEYDINSEVDFQGYIKRMLDIRVNKSYSMPEKEKRDHISTLRSPDINIENLIDSLQLEGDIKSTTWYNSRKSEHTITTDNGEVLGIDSKLTSLKSDNSMDTSLIDLMDALEHDSHLDYFQLEIVRGLINSSASPEVILSSVATKYNQPLNKINDEYNDLKEVLLQYID